MPNDYSRAVIERQSCLDAVAGLFCPLLAVSNTVANATGLALASAFVR